MSRLPFSTAPLIAFLDEDLAEVAAMAQAEVKAASAAEGVSRPRLVGAVRGGIIAAHRNDTRLSGLRRRLETFGVDPLTELGGADLSRMQLAGEKLAGADLRRTDFRRSNLANADLARANLGEANLAEAVLTAANLAGARLDQANLAGADLSRASLAGASFVGASIEGAVGLPEAARRAARISPEVAALLRQLCGTEPTEPLSRTGRLILAGEWDEATRLLAKPLPRGGTPKADKLRQSTELVRVMLEMLKGEAHAAAAILAAVRGARIP